jgi:hypothetical protein
VPQRQRVRLIVQVLVLPTTEFLKASVHQTGTL